MSDNNSNLLSETDRAKIQGALDEYQKHLYAAEKKKSRALAIQILRQTKSNPMIPKDGKKELPDILQRVESLPIGDVMVAETPAHYSAKISKLLRECNSFNLIGAAEGQEKNLLASTFQKKCDKDDDLVSVKNKFNAILDIHKKLFEPNLTVYAFKKFVTDQETTLSIRRSGFVKTLNAFLEKIGLGKDFFKTTAGIDGAKLAKSIHGYFGGRGKEEGKTNPIEDQQLSSEMKNNI